MGKMGRGNVRGDERVKCEGELDWEWELEGDVRVK